KVQMKFRLTGKCPGAGIDCSRSVSSRLAAYIIAGGPFYQHASTGPEQSCLPRLFFACPGCIPAVALSDEVHARAGKDGDEDSVSRQVSDVPIRSWLEQSGYEQSA